VGKEVYKVGKQSRFNVPTGEFSPLRATVLCRALLTLANSNIDESHVYAAQNDQSAKQVRFGRNELSSAPPTSPPMDVLGTKSLCDTLRKADISDINLQVSFQNGIFLQDKTRPKRLQIGSQQDISLNNLLRGSGQGLKLRDKLILAVVLSHAAMHYSDSPWLRAGWSKEQVCFFMRPGDLEPDFSRPFLTLAVTNFSAITEDANDHLFHPSPNLLSLGILLLEIGEGSPIESHWSTEDLSDGTTPNENTNLTAALHLLEDSDQDLTVGYRSAVRACLNWNVVDGDMGGDSLVGRIYEMIVEPLERELDYGFGIVPEQLSLTGVKW
jgi:hypothetical protein